MTSVLDGEIVLTRARHLNGPLGKNPGRAEEPQRLKRSGSLGRADRPDRCAARPRSSCQRPAARIPRGRSAPARPESIAPPTGGASLQPSTRSAAAVSRRRPFSNVDLNSLRPRARRGDSAPDRFVTHAEKDRPGNAGTWRTRSRRSQPAESARSRPRWLRRLTEPIRQQRRAQRQSPPDPLVNSSPASWSVIADDARRAPITHGAQPTDDLGSATPGSGRLIPGRPRDTSER